MRVEIKSYRQEVLNATKAAIERTLEAIGIQAESHAKNVITAESRIDTDTMRGSVAHQVDNAEQAVYIGTNVKYAVYNELGTGIYAEGGGGRKTPWMYVDRKGQWHRTVGMKPIHFLKKSLDDHKAEYEKIAQQYLKL